MKIAIVGLGNIGGAVLRAVGGVVSVIDTDPSMAGRDAGEMAGTDRLELPVRSDLESAFVAPPDVAIITTGSRLEAVAPVVLTALAAGADVISSCEELAWPWETSPQLAEEISTAAVAANRSVIGVGVNPGFVQDLLVLVAGGASRNVTAIAALRHVDLVTRRAPLLAKMGVGLTPEEFAELRPQGNIGHVGLEQSAQLIAAGLGWRLGEVALEDGPLIAEHDLRTGESLVGKGLVRGMWMRAEAASDRGRITLELEMGVGTAPQDRIEITGEPPVTMVLEGGLSGDEATVSRIVNSIPVMQDVRPGLLSVLDLPPVPRALA